jgi:hypothetical protein
MKARRSLVTSFDELMATRYGQPEERLLRDPGSVEDLLANYYGRLPARPKRANGVASAATLSLQCDDGKKVLAQRPRPSAASHASPWSMKSATSDGSQSRIGPLETAPDAVVAPSQPAVRAQSREPQFEIPSPSADGAHADEVDRRALTATESEFLKDMQAICAGQSVYDPVQQMTVRKTDLKEQPREMEPRDESKGRGPGASDSQAIFERIAKSMQHAGAYDLGGVELENRFSDFDRLDDLQEKAAEKKSTAKPRPPKDAKVDDAEFIEDLDAIRKQAAPVEAALQPQVARDASVPDKNGRASAAQAQTKLIETAIPETRSTTTLDVPHDSGGST